MCIKQVREVFKIASFIDIYQRFCYNISQSNAIALVALCEVKISFIYLNYEDLSHISRFSI